MLPEPNPRAAIALVKWNKASGAEFLVIERAHDPRDFWSGHLSFPGGKLEVGEPPLAAAIRETFEEVALSLQSEELIETLAIGFAGRPGVFGMWVQPFVFEVQKPTDLQIDPKEIAQAFWVQQDDLINPKNWKQKPMIPSEPDHLLPCIQIGTKYLWGFSLSVLLQHLKLEISF